MLQYVWTRKFYRPSLQWSAFFALCYVLLLFPTSEAAFQRLVNNFLDVLAEHDFFDFVTFEQQIAASGHLLYRHPHSYYYAQRIVVPSRTL